jgi:hypothetical protein
MLEKVYLDRLNHHDSGFPFLLGKLHIALAPMNGVQCLNIWLNVTDIDRIDDRANLETHGSILVDLQYLMRSTEGRLIFILGTLAQHNLVIDMIGMRDARLVLVCIILFD